MYFITYSSNLAIIIVNFYFYLFWLFFSRTYLFPLRFQTYLTMIVETHFQMNYSSGQWTRIKKFKRLEDA